MDNYKNIPEGYEIPEKCPSTSELPTLFWFSGYGDPLTDAGLKRWSKSEFAPSPFSENAHDPSWQKNIDRKIYKIEATLRDGGICEEALEQAIELVVDLNKWMMDQAFEADPKSVVECLLERMKMDACGEALVTGTWLRFEQIASEFQKNDPDGAKTILFEYMLSHKRTQFKDDIEILLVMLIAWFEFLSLCPGDTLGFLYKVSSPRRVPLKLWMPVEKSGELKTTRYQVMNHFLKNIFPAEHRRNRTAERFRGEPQWNNSLELKKYKPIDIKAVISYFGLGKVTELESFLLGKTVQFAYFFGLYQIQMFKAGVPAKDIVKSFERINFVQESFQKGLVIFREQRKVA